MSQAFQSLVPPPVVALAKLEAAACRDLAAARVTLGLFNTIVGDEPALLFPKYRWRLCDVNSLARALAASASEIMTWGAQRHVILNPLLASRATIARAVSAQRRESPHGRRQRAIANRYRKMYPQVRPCARPVRARTLNLHQIDILSDEIGRPVGEGLLRLARAFRPTQIEFIAHGDGEYLSARAGTIRIRLGEDGYTVVSISLTLETPAAKRPRIVMGFLEDFFETGTEGVIWSLISEEERGYDALFPIEEGDHLTIQDQLGRKLWSGKIRCDRKSGWRRYPLNSKYGQPSALGHWVHWTQRGFKPDDWARYFIRPEHDRMRGILRRNPPAG